MYTYKIYDKYGIKLLTFDALSQAGGIKHCFTTRKGGVSNGYCESLNFSKTRDFDDRNVNENARRLAESLDVDYNKLTVVPQVHGCEVKVIDEENCGAGFSKPRFEEGYDAMITDVAGIPLMTLHGDCVPVFLYDPVRRAIGIDCFEVDMPVYDELLKSFPCMAENERLAVAGRIPSKKQVSLPGLVEQALLEGGIKKEKIIDCGICTCCEENAEDYFSHRRTGGKTGIMAGVICLV